MADDNYSIIKPVESMQNIAGLTPAKRREERKRRENLRKKNKQDQQIEEQNPNEKPEDDTDNRGSIDYRA